MPTLLAAAGIPCGDSGGSDLRSSDGDLVVDGGLPPDLLYRIAGEYKLVIDRHRGRRLFAISDPAESRDLSLAMPKLVEAMATGLTMEPLADSKEAKGRLRALGYVASPINAW
jgi:hypothetical protein